MNRKWTILLVCGLVMALIVGGTGMVPVAPAAAQVVYGPTHDDPGDYLWDSTEVTQITLNGDSISVDGTGATAVGSQVTVSAAGTYSISGSLTDGAIIVDSQDEALVRLILNGAEIHSSTSAPIQIMNAAEAMIVLADGTQNAVSDGAAYVFASSEDDEPNAAIFSRDDLTISGNGSLLVTANYNDGIASKDGLVISGGTISVNAVDDGIRGKDYLVLRDGTLTIQAQGDGLKSDNEEDATLGYISIENGVVNVTSGGGAIQAQTAVTIAGGEFVLSAGGGSGGRIDASASAKGIKAGVSVTIAGGMFTIDTADDAIHSNDAVTINDGTFLISSGDDGVHADASVEINGGDINITRSYEGVESAVITINAGTLHVTSSDDGLNVVGGNDGSGMFAGSGRGGRGQPGQTTTQGQGFVPGQESFATSTDYYLYIHGGYIVVDAGGDGLDINSAIEMTDGVLIVNGPTENMNGALDYDVSFKLTGGFLIAAGSSGMAQAPDQSSTQASLLINFSTPLQSGSLIHLQTSDGVDLLTFAPTKTYQSIAFSSPELTLGATVDVYYGGTADGTALDSLYQGGTYTPGTQYASLTLSSIVTGVGNRVR